MDGAGEEGLSDPLHSLLPGTGVLRGEGKGPECRLTPTPTPCHLPIGAEGVRAAPAPRAGAAGVGAAGPPGRLLLPGRVSLGHQVGCEPALGGSQPH